MANLVELSNQLEDFPEQQLVQMSQDPNSMYPSYLVLSEIQRRNQMRKMYEAQQPKPETTVAEEVIGEFTGQQGLQGAMAQSPGPQNAFPPSDMGNMAPPSPMQMMASGGRTGFQVGGSLDFNGRDSLSQTFINPMENQIADEELEQILEARKTFPRNEDGSIDKSAVAKAVASGLLTATAAAALIIPEPTTSAAGAARLATTGFGKNLLQLPGKIKSGLQGFMGKRALKKDPMKRFGPEDAKGLKPLQTTKQIGSQEIKNLNLTTRGVGLGGAALGANLMMDNDVEKEIDDNAPSNKKPTNELLNTILNKDKETKRKGLGDPLDLARFGFTIMGARNTSELASGLGGLVSDIQGRDKEIAEQEYIRAQTDALVANANMKLPDAYYKLASTYGAQITAAQDAGDKELATALSNKLSQIQAAMAKALGLNILTQEEQDAAALQALGIGNA